jgi:hypothetical protein
MFDIVRTEVALPDLFEGEPRQSYSLIVDPWIGD